MKSYPDNRYYREIFDSKCYDYLPQNPKVVLDIGANAGMFSLWASDKAEIIYAIEPDLPTYKRLITTLVENQLTNVVPIFGAVSGSTGIQTLYCDNSDGGNSLVNQYDHHSQQVFGMTLATLITCLGLAYVDVVKIDVEGAEEDIFRSGDFATVAEKIGLIVGEDHSKDVEHPLTDLGFSYTKHNAIFVAERNHD